jgi:two-component system CheB/CheR fusion protein
LAPSTVDVVAEIEAIGPLLRDLVIGAYAAVPPDDERRLATLLSQLRSKSGIDFSPYKEPTIRRRLQRRIADTGTGTLAEYVRYMRRHPDEYKRLAASFLIKVTDFFRDSELYEYLRERVLPELITTARTRGNNLRMWSAGCATGEEAYSLAILLRELLGDELESFKVRIFATDLDAEAVAFARRGIYPASAISDLPPDLVERMFVPLDGAFEVNKTVRSMLVFGQHDLGQRAPFPRIDLALCRNVLIYFTPDLQRRTLHLFAFALRDRGVLVLGKSETITPVAEHFTLLDPRLKVYRRQGEPILIPSTRIHEATPMPLPHGASGKQRSAMTSSDRDLARAHVRQATSPIASEPCIEPFGDMPLGVVTLGVRYEIQSINAAARHLLAIHKPAIGEDLIHLVDSRLGGPIRSAIDAVRGDINGSVRVTGNLLPPETPGELRSLDITAFAHQVAPEHAGLWPVNLLIVDVSDRENERRRLADELAQARAQASREIEERRRTNTDLTDQLARSTEKLVQVLRANEELARVNTTMTERNEQLFVTYEEAQAAMEEIETLNEEQQATNEELETLNEELQATVEELNTTNDDLQARGVELQAQAAELDAQQARLAAVLANMADAVLVLDTHGTPILSNAAFQLLFGDALPALQDEAGEPLSPEADPSSRLARGEKFRLVFATVNPDGSRRWFEASGQPIHGDGLQGGVLTIRDVPERGVRRR